jgi:hypothetical protein
MPRFPVTLTTVAGVIEKGIISPPARFTHSF